MQISITFPSGELETKHFYKQQITIGRSNQCEFVVTHESLSRKHCLIELVDGNFFVTDLGSSNGTYLDGRRLPPKTRSPLTTFMQFSIGVIECQVADSDEALEAKPVNQISSAVTPPNRATRSTKMIKYIAPKTGAARSHPKKNNFLPLIAVSIVLVAGIYHYFSNQNEKVSQGTVIADTSLVEKNVPAQFVSIKDVTLTVGDYEAIESDKTCSNAALCAELKLSVDKAEGIVQKDGEYFIFVHESHLALTPLITHSALKKSSDALDFAVLFDVFNSELFNQFQQKKVGQIHIIIKNSNFMNRRIYRFHTKYFTNNERGRLLTEIGASLRSGDTANFWKYAKPIIKTQDL